MCMRKPMQGEGERRMTIQSVLLTPKTINNERQNHPELVVQDARELLGLDDGQCDVLRMILLRRGVNKWLYARRRFIRLKHWMKPKVMTATRKDFQHAYEEMVHICTMPRWVEWRRHVHRDMRRNEEEATVVGAKLYEGMIGAIQAE